jgi:hypothetical protein
VSGVVIFLGGMLAGCFLGVAIMALANLLSNMDAEDLPETDDE